MHGAAGHRATAAPATAQRVNDSTEAIGRALRSVRQSMRANKFGDARAQLDQVEKAVAIASTQTRAHPEFEDLADAVEQLRPKLEQLEATYLAQRKQETIASLLAQTSRTFEEVALLVKELRHRPPEPQDLTTMDTFIDDLKRIASQGRPHLDDPTFREQSERRDQKALALAQHRLAAGWVVQAEKQLRKQVAAARKALQQAKLEQDSTAAHKAYHTASKHLLACAQTLARPPKQVRPQEQWYLDTELGVLNVPDTRGQCSSLSLQVQERLRGLRWEREAQEAVTALDAALQPLRNQQDHAATQAKVTAALQVLQATQDTLRALSQQPFADLDLVFASVIGEGTVEELQTLVGKQADRLRQAQPALEWRTRTQEAITTLGAALGDLGVSRTRRRDILQTCVEELTALAAEPHADDAALFDSLYGRRTIGTVRDQCAMRLKQ